MPSSSRHHQVLLIGIGQIERPHPIEVAVGESLHTRKGGLQVGGQVAHAAPATSTVLAANPCETLDKIGGSMLFFAIDYDLRRMGIPSVGGASIPAGPPS